MVHWRAWRARRGVESVGPHRQPVGHRRRTMTWSAPTTDPGAASTAATTPSTSLRSTLRICGGRWEGGQRSANGAMVVHASAGSKPAHDRPTNQSSKPLVNQPHLHGFHQCHLVAPAHALPRLDRHADQGAGHRRLDELRSAGRLGSAGRGDGGRGGERGQTAWAASDTSCSWSYTPSRRPHSPTLLMSSAVGTGMCAPSAADSGLSTCTSRCAPQCCRRSWRGPEDSTCTCTAASSTCGAGEQRACVREGVGGRAPQPCTAQCSRGGHRSTALCRFARAPAPSPAHRRTRAWTSCAVLRPVSRTTRMRCGSCTSRACPSPGPGGGARPGAAGRTVAGTCRSPNVSTSSSSPCRLGGQVERSGVVPACCLGSAAVSRQAVRQAGRRPGRSRPAARRRR